MSAPRRQAFVNAPLAQALLGLGRPVLRMAQGRKERSSGYGLPWLLSRVVKVVQLGTSRSFLSMG